METRYRGSRSRLVRDVAIDVRLDKMQFQGRFHGGPCFLSRKVDTLLLTQHVRAPRCHVDSTKGVPRPDLSGERDACALPRMHVKNSRTETKQNLFCEWFTWNQNMVRC
jgi:hypothetical protein